MNGKWNVDRTTHYQLLRIKGMEDLLREIKKDNDKEQRLKRQECTYCYYRSCIAGQGFTNYTCGICVKENSHSNTAVPAICLPCAKEHNLCQQCGGDINYDEHRNLNL